VIFASPALIRTNSGCIHRAEQKVTLISIGEPGNLRVVKLF
jgi:hypothetical protein